MGRALPEGAYAARRVLVTGGGGFIGSHLVHALVRRGAHVRVLDDFSTGSRRNLEEVADAIEVQEGDVRRPEDCAAACRGIEVVFHEAALPSVALSVEAPEDSHAVNATGTLNLVRAAVAQGVERLVYAGSSSAYGESELLPKREDMLAQPVSPYAASKLAGEYYVQLAARLWGLHTVVLRYFNVFGARQDPTSQYSAVIPKFITAMKAGRAPTIFGDGLQSRDFAHVDNVVHANLLAGTSPAACSGRVYNIACGGRVSLLELVEKLNEVLGTRIEPEFAPPRPGDVKHSQADITRAREELGYEPIVSFEEGLRRTVEAY
ncbi:MAG: SDR family oxidoreductase [Planctomycetota bacterium]|nr:MAG: SDR family oxidoreductase [Planctomycetota bacterium]